MKSGPACMVWAVVVWHLWLGVVFIDLGKLPPNLISVRWFYEMGGAPIWGPCLILSSLMAVIGMWTPSRDLSIVLVAPQQIVMLAGVVYGLAALASSPGPFTKIAVPAMVVFALGHSAAIVVHYLDRWRDA